MKILNFGSCNIDYVYSLDHIVEIGETETTDGLAIFPGGKGLNQSIAVSKAGALVYHAGCIGCDGEMLLNVLTENGIDVSLLRRTEEKSGHAVIQVSKKGENSIFLYPGANETVSKTYIDEVLSYFGKGDILLLQNEISNVDYIVDEAHRKGMCIILNPSPFNARIEKIDMHKICYILINEVEARSLVACNTSYDAPAEIQKKYPHIRVVLTLGSKGCMYRDEKEELYQAAYRVEVADTTAAGDTFTGYFVAGIAKGKPLCEVLKTAAVAAAIAVSRKGAAPSIPDEKEVITVMQNLEEYADNVKYKSVEEKIKAYTEKHLKTASLTELSEILGYSPVYTGSLVKKLEGESFTKLVQRKRCEKAAKMLLETDLSVKEIILKVGYENEHFFRKAFKERYGKNPLEYRKGVKKL